MKVLSLRQPWAWMVVHGGKRIENRVWNTRFRGTFLIHAAKGMTRAECEDAVVFARDVEPGLVVPPRRELAFGGIVGVARIVDVLPPCKADMFGDCEHPWHMPDQFGFVIEDVAPLDFVPMRGSLGFFDAPATQRRGGAT